MEEKDYLENVQPEEMADKLVPITNRFMFARVMRDPELCREMLERILGFKIRKLSYIEPEKTTEEIREAKGIRLDIYAEDDSDKVFDVECQPVNTLELPKRSRYYQSQMDVSILERGDDYSALPASFVIFICTFDLFGMGRHVYTFTRCCKEIERLELGDESTIIFLNAKGKENDCSKKLKAFLDYFAGKNNGSDSFTEKLHETVKYVNKDKKWRREMMTVEMEYKVQRTLGERSAREADRFGDVSEGLYSPEIGAKKLGMSVDEFLENMQKAGYSLPQ